MAGDAAAVNRTAFPPLLRLLVAGAAVVVIVMGLRAVSSVLTIFMVALVLAESLAPAMQWLMRRGLPAAWASILTVLVSLVSGVVLLGLLINSLTRLVQTLPGYGEKLQELAASAEGLLTRMHVDTTHLTTGLLDPHKVLSAATEVGSHLIDTLGHAVFVLLLVAFMLIDFAVQGSANAGLARSLRWVPRAESFGSEIRAYMRITALMALIGALADLAALLVLRVDYAVTWAVLAFFVSFIPVVGFVLAMIPPAAIALLQYGWDRALLVVVLYVLISFVNDNVIRPRFMSHGFQVAFVELFFSLLFWGWVFGPVGTILAVPLTLVVRQVVDQFGIDPAMIAAAQAAPAKDP